MSTKVTVSKSGIHGKGIFATRDIAKGEIVFIIKGPRMFKVNNGKKDALSHPDWVGFKMNNWVDPIPPYKYLNHSCNPNCGIKGKVEVVALKDIKKGDETTTDYSIIEADQLWSMKCACGEKNCRKIIKSIQFLPTKQFSRYFPYIPTYFRTLYLKNHKIKPEYT
ncbi:MAG: SET domain-containing protein-lysine N-methyltransferase [Candidatus Paceibacterota bacterium]|jgi:hypothetical protein